MRCGEIENYSHLLWACNEARLIWEAYNSYVRQTGMHGCQILSFEDIFTTESNRAISMLKVRIIQTMIQIERPSGWNIEKIRKQALELICIEVYNSPIKHNLPQTETKWKLVK